MTLKVNPEPPNPAVMIEVIDTGIGVRAEDQAVLFKPFHQLDQGLQRQFEGSGLGLAICRRLLDMMHGTIDVDSRQGKGSRFRVRIPFANDPRSGA